MRFERDIGYAPMIVLDERDIDILSSANGNQLFGRMLGLWRLVEIGIDEEDSDNAEVGRETLAIWLSDIETFPRCISRSFIEPVGCLDNQGGLLIVSRENSAENLY